MADKKLISFSYSIQMHNLYLHLCTLSKFSKKNYEMPVFATDKFQVNDMDKHLPEILLVLFVFGSAFILFSSNFMFNTLALGAQGYLYQIAPRLQLTNSFLLARLLTSCSYWSVFPSQLLTMPSPLPGHMVTSGAR